MLVAPSVCDVESFCTSQIIYIFKTKHHKISIAWLRIFFTLFKFIWVHVDTVLCKSNEGEFQRISTNFDKKWRKKRIFKGNETWTNCPWIFETAIVLTSSKYQWRWRKAAWKVAQLFVECIEVSREFSMSNSNFQKIVCILCWWCTVYCFSSFSLERFKLTIKFLWVALTTTDGRVSMATCVALI